MKLKLLERYIAKNVLGSIGLVTLLLIGLQVFILFVRELDDLGKGHYDISQAALFVLLQTPYQVYLFFPMASLLGSLVGLGMMASNRELVVMQASGMSIGQITTAVLKAALLVIVIVTIAGETIIPELAAQAGGKKFQAISGGQALRTSHGVWLRSHNHFIHIGEVLPKHELHQVIDFQFDAHHRLELARKIATLRYDKGQWHAYDISETRFTAESTKTYHYPKMGWNVFLNPTLLELGDSEPEEMTLSELNRYLRIQKKNHLSAFNYELAFYQRLMQPLTTLVMMILAIPFIFGPLRSSTMGSKLVIGACVGFGFYIFNRIIGAISQVYQLPVEVAAIGPTLLFALLGVYLLVRVRK